ncbi:MAG: OstA-like protein [candidate division WOR-3 bacterium]
MSLSKLLLVLGVIGWLFAADISAPKMEIQEKDQKRVLFFPQGVVITDKETRLSANQALFYEQDNFAWLYDSVTISNPTSIVLAETLFYDFNTKTGRLRGNVVVQTETLEIRSPELTYAQRANYLKADTCFILRDKIHQLIISGTSAWYDLSQDVGEVTQDPILYIIRGDTLKITSKFMRLENQAGCFYAYESVRVLNPSSVLTCDTLVYLIKENVAEARGEPLLVERSNYLKSSSIRFYLVQADSTNQGTLQSVEATGPVSVRYLTNEQGIVELTGQRFIARYENGELKEIIIQHQDNDFVTGKYHAPEEL